MMSIVYRYARVDWPVIAVIAIALAACGGGPGSTAGSETDRGHSVSAGREGPHDPSFR